MAVTAVAIYNAKLAVVDVEAECFLAGKSYGDCTVTKATPHFPTFPSVFLLLLLASRSDRICDVGKTRTKLDGH